MVLPLLVVAGVAIAGLVVAGCSEPAEEENPAGVPQPNIDAAPKGPECDAFKKSPQYSQIDDRSFDTMNYLWGNNLSQSNISAWNPRARLYFGAAHDLLKPLCENSGEPDESIAKYRTGAIEFFHDYYLQAPVFEGVNQMPIETNILVLLGGLANTRADESVIIGALSSLGKRGEANPEFVKVLKAGYYFNMAVDAAKVVDRYSNLQAATDLSADDIKNAENYTAQARELLSSVNLRELATAPSSVDDDYDRQIEFFIALNGAVQRLEDSLKNSKPRITVPDDGLGKTGKSGKKGGSGSGEKGKGKGKNKLSLQTFG